MNHIIALSGGKDSTAMALRLAEIEPRDYTYLCTPTGDELPEMLLHWDRLETLLGKPILRITNGTLESWIEHFKALPNWRQRWCTRVLKIEPCIAYLKAHQPATLYVGLRADEEERQGLYGDHATYRYPLREWEWGLEEVWAYINERGIKIPRRTDCARCFGQRLIEWKRLWKEHPEIYADAVAQEERIGATFRSPGRDTWPASLKLLAVEFESGRKVRGEDKDAGEEYAACVQCRL
jgi:3'-phosphoadenosine 5'-phosphosulfate sulfotransferase (PAPS reductase)/FAD synthetase